MPPWQQLIDIQTFTLDFQKIRASEKRPGSTIRAVRGHKSTKFIHLFQGNLLFCAVIQPFNTGFGGWFLVVH